MGRIFISSADVAILEGLTPQRACYVLRSIMESLGKQRPQKVLIKEYASFRGVSESDILNVLKHEKSL